VISLETNRQGEALRPLFVSTLNGLAAVVAQRRTAKKWPYRLHQGHLG
jgi:hypothetical protein